MSCQKLRHLREGIRANARQNKGAVVHARWRDHHPEASHCPGLLVNAVAIAPKAIRGDFTSDSFRSLVQIGDFSTERTEADRIFSRYIKGDSNQRRLTEDEVIENFTAIGECKLQSFVDVDDFTRILSYAIQVIGVGSARKMGYGRGVVVSPKLDTPLDFSGKKKEVVLQ